MITRKRMTCLALAGLALLGLAACSSATSDSAKDGVSASATVSDSAQALPPVFIDPDEVAGTTVEVALDNSAVVSVDDVENWSAEVSDSSVAKWTAGGTENGTTYNPGFQPIEEGSTEVKLISPEGKETVFTLKVVAAE